MNSTHLPDVHALNRTDGAVVGPVAVLGFARTGIAVVKALIARGVEVQVIDDRPSAASARTAAELGVEIHEAPLRAELGALLAGMELVVVSPGVPPAHPVFELAGDRVISEVELAGRLCRVPVVAITGTNGKTTVTTLVASMLQASGYRAKAVGNIGEAFIGVVDDDDLDIAVCEVSSFQLAYTKTFAPSVGTWLNLADDHLDWHDTMDDYIGAKARIWAEQRAEDVAIANREDPIVLGEAAKVKSRLVTFGWDSADYFIADGRFIGPAGEEFGSVGVLPRAFPHDQLNALAAIATAHQAGASPQACMQGLESFVLPPHRVAFVSSRDGVDYYDDSKATTPSAVIAALQGFPSVVLIAGGRNKGLDLGQIASAAGDPASAVLRGVVAIGEASDEVEAAFAGLPVVRATSMDDAVARASEMAQRGDAVLLSPGCASFDWYESYAARGEDFIRAVEAHPSALTEEAR